MLRPGGTATLIGMIPLGVEISLPGVDFLDEKTVKGSNMGSTRSRVDIPRYLHLYRSGRIKLDELISRTRPLEEIGAGRRRPPRGPHVQEETFLALALPDPVTGRHSARGASWLRRRRTGLEARAYPVPGCRRDRLAVPSSADWALCKECPQEHDSRPRSRLEPRLSWSLPGDRRAWSRAGSSRLGRLLAGWRAAFSQEAPSESAQP